MENLSHADRHSASTRENVGAEQHLETSEQTFPAANPLSSPLWPGHDFSQSDSRNQTAGNQFRLDSPHLGEQLQRAKQLHLDHQLDQAAEAYRGILKHNPQHPIAWAGLGQIALQSGHFIDAAEFLQTAIEHQPDFAFAHYTLARVYQATGDFVAASQALIHATQRQPRFLAGLLELAKVSEKLGKSADAESAYRQALRLAPEHEHAWNSLGLLLLKRKQHHEAAACFRKALAKAADFPQAANNLGLVLIELGNFDGAIEAFEVALQKMPNSPDVLSNLAHAYLSLDRLEEAESACQAAIQAEPQHIAALSQYGQLRLRQGRPEDAKTALEMVARRSPFFADGYNNLGAAHYALNDDWRAISAFHRALELNPQLVEAHYNRSLAFFRQGQFEQGWDDYAWRWRRKGARKLACDIPEWTGQPLGGKTLLIYGEQGIGDELMLATRYREVIHSAAHCVLACDPRLVPLFARSFPETTVIALPELRRAISGYRTRGQIDFVIPAGEFPRYAAQKLGEQLPPPPYLRPSSESVQKWRDRYARFGQVFRIGISWRGGATAQTRNQRSTVLAAWKPLFQLSQTMFVNLQYGDCHAELSQAQREMGVAIHDWADADPLKDLEDFAAQIAALDLVITIDNSTAHMAGALGVPTWVALPESPDWRWKTVGSTSYWYQSLTLFRKERKRDWASLFAQMAENLTETETGACRRRVNEF